MPTQYLTTFSAPPCAVCGTAADLAVYDAPDGPEKEQPRYYCYSHRLWEYDQIGAAQAFWRDVCSLPIAVLFSQRE